MAVVALDSSVVIAHRDANDAHHQRATSALAARSDAYLLLPLTAYAEVLVVPYRHSSGEVAKLEAYLIGAAIQVQPTTIEMARRAAALRAQHRSLRLPEALVIATADVLEVDALLTADARWRPYSSRVVVI